MSNKAIIGNIEARIDELRRELSLLQGALKVLGRNAEDIARRAGRAIQVVHVGDSLYNLYCKHLILKS